MFQLFHLNLIKYIFLKNGSTSLRGNLNLNNSKITNLQKGTQETDSINLKQLNESHITSHTNRENVFEYVMKLSSEFSVDFGIISVNLVNNFEDMPHLKKTAFVFSLQKSNQNSEYKGKFDVKLFKLIKDNFSSDFTLAVEFYFQKQSFPIYSNDFISMTLKFASLNMIILKQLSKIVSKEYHYIRTIPQMQPNSTSNKIERRLYVTLTATYDNNSPKSRPLYFACYGIKNALQNNVDISIYDFDKSYEIVSKTMKMQIPFDMNGFDILKTSHYLPIYQTKLLSLWR